MMGQIRKYSPLAAIAGYLLVYMNKGYDRILVDIQNITVDSLIAKWQNFAIAGVALVAIGIVKKMKLPPLVKTLLILVLYGIAGHQVATAIDPPYYGSNVGNSMVLNPYRGA